MTTERPHTDHGQARTSGDDAIQVAITSPSGSTEEVTNPNPNLSPSPNPNLSPSPNPNPNPNPNQVVATVHDYANGRYEIS